MRSKSIHAGEVLVVESLEVWEAWEERLVEDEGSLKEEGGMGVGYCPKYVLSKAVEVKNGLRDRDSEKEEEGEEKE